MAYYVFSPYSMKNDITENKLKWPINILKDVKFSIYGIINDILIHSLCI
jgi:hypothetical protein